MDLKEIVEEIKRRGLTAYKIAQDLPEEYAITEVGINKLISGSSRNPRRKTLEILEKYLRGALPGATDRNKTVGQTEMRIVSDAPTESICTDGAIDNRKIAAYVVEHEAELMAEKNFNNFVQVHRLKAKLEATTDIEERVQRAILRVLEAQR